MVEFVPQLYRILAVDDSIVILDMVKMMLREADFQVSTATSGEEALDLMKKEGLPHLAIVDINMPLGMDGFEFCEALHDFSDVPVIMLTAVDQSETIIQAIEEHAEDYMTKPVSAGELVARVRRVLRSIGGFALKLERLTRADERLAVNFVECEVLINGRPISLTPTETKLLYILMRDAGKLVTTDFLLRRLWPHELAYQDRLRVYVHRLRSKIEERPEEPRYVVSRRNKGYSFLPGLEEQKIASAARGPGT